MCHDDSQSQMPRSNASSVQLQLHLEYSASMTLCLICITNTQGMVSVDLEAGEKCVVCHELLFPLHNTLIQHCQPLLSGL